MLAQDIFNTSSTNVKLLVPEDTTGVERIMLAAQGDLQRLLSSFFANPITINTIYAKHSPRLAPASPAQPIIQLREVQLICAERIVCTATSTVTVTSPECERLLLDEKYPIGQLFRKLRRAAQFTLLNVEARYNDGERELERTYRLETEGIMCEIKEVFPDRDMFLRGQRWLEEGKPKARSNDDCGYDDCDCC